jgi:hypothetical protein
MNIANHPWKQNLSAPETANNTRNARTHRKVTNMNATVAIKENLL